jgi:hypothetical protein
MGTKEMAFCGWMPEEASFGTSFIREEDNGPWREKTPESQFSLQHSLRQQWDLAPTKT